jgi:hypothetical protein
MSDALGALIGWTFIVAVALSPAIFGGNVPLAWGWNAMVFGALAASLIVLAWFDGRWLPVSWARVRVPATAFVIVLFWVFLQSQSWVPRALHAPEWSTASKLLSESYRGYISVNPSETNYALLRLATGGAVFLLAMQLGRSGPWALRIVAGIAVGCALHAAYAMTLAFAGVDEAGSILSPALFKIDQVSTTTGTFINRNHFAMYLCLGLTCAWVLAARDVRKSLSDHGFRGASESIAKGIAVLIALSRNLFLLVPLWSALLMTTSRAGFVLGCVSLILVLALDHAHIRLGRTKPYAPKRRSREMLITGAFGIVGTLGLLAAHGGMLVDRVAGSNKAADIDSRIAVAKVSIKAIGDRPFLGWGYGTFADVFPLYRDDTIDLAGRWSEAHNGFIEAAIGLGVVFSAVLFFVLGYIFYRCMIGAIYRERSRFAPVAAVVACILVGMHSLVDFSIQIQGVTLTFAALFGVGYAQSWSTREPRQT